MLVEFEKFVFSLIGAILGGSFVAWIGGYYAERGKRDLLREEWPKLLDEAREKAHAEEAGKRLATKEDIDSVVEQVRAITRETEGIKASISSDVWMRQWLMNQKRDVYATLIQRMDELWDLWDESDKLMAHAQNAFEHSLALAPLNEKLVTAERYFRSTMGLAIIFLSTSTVSALERYVDGIAQHLGPNLGTRQSALGDLKVAVVQAAKEELTANA